MQRMTCPDCQRLQMENQRLLEENTRLQRENGELRSRLAAYENPHTPPSRRRYPVRRRRALGSPRYPGQAEGASGEDEAPAEAGRGEDSGVEGEM